MNPDTDSTTFSRRNLAPGITLYHMQSSKWKTDLLKLVFLDDLDHGVAARSLAGHLVRHGHARLRGMDEVSKFLQGLWGAAFSAHMTRTARHHLTVVRAQVVSSRFLPRRPDSLAKMVAFVDRMLHAPWMGEEDFDPKLVEIERANLLRAIDAIADNKSQYAHKRLGEELFRGHQLAIAPWGERKDVALVTPAEARSVWRSTVTTRPVLIYVISPRDMDDVVDLFRRKLTLAPRTARVDTVLRLPTPRRSPQRVIERQDIAQSRLAMGFRVHSYRRQRDAYACSLADHVFGGDSSSRLFKIAREKHGLAYSIGTSFDDRTGTIWLSAGIDRKNLVAAEKIIRHQIRDIAAGKISEHDVAIALAAIDKSLDATRDSQEALVAFHLGLTLNGRRERTLEETRRRFHSVSRAAMAAAFRRVRLDTSFLLMQSSRRRRVLEAEDEA